MGKFPWKLKQALNRKRGEMTATAIEESGVVHTPQIEKDSRDEFGGEVPLGTQSKKSGELNSMDSTQEGQTMLEEGELAEVDTQGDSSPIREENRSEELMETSMPVTPNNEILNDSSPSLRRSRRNLNKSQENTTATTSNDTLSNGLGREAKTTSSEPTPIDEVMTSPTRAAPPSSSPPSPTLQPVDSPSASGTSSAKKVRIHPTSFHQCSVCGKMYKHRNCLTKHAWEHHESWSMTKRWCQTKHQQVQMLEAAQVLTEMMLMSTPCSSISPSSSCSYSSSTAVSNSGGGAGTIVSTGLIAKAGIRDINPVPITPKAADKLPLPSRVATSVGVATTVIAAAARSD